MPLGHGAIAEFAVASVRGGGVQNVGSPFISESIWTEALQDVAPILGRGGRTADGKQI